MVGGLQKYSDLDLFVVSKRPTTGDEKKKLINSLLQISGVYMKTSKLPIELTIVVKSDVDPWRYPPKFDFQYGDWLRSEFEAGIIELLSPVPPHDLILATIEGLKNLQAELHGDTRNVLLTCARIWNRLETNTIICSKPDAASWAINQLPGEYQPVLQRDKAICIGEINEHWDDLVHLIQPCADYMLTPY